jgi:hypothetical protein
LQVFVFVCLCSIYTTVHGWFFKGCLKMQNAMGGSCEVMG